MLCICKQTDWLLGKVIQSQIKSCTILRSPLPQSAGMSVRGGIYRDLRLFHCLCFNYKLYELCKPYYYFILEIIMFVVQSLQVSTTYSHFFTFLLNYIFFIINIVLLLWFMSLKPVCITLFVTINATINCISSTYEV